MIKLKEEDRVYYTEHPEDESDREYGTVSSVYYTYGELDAFGVEFDNDDFDEFNGEGLGEFVHVVPSCSFCQGDNAIFHDASHSVFIDSQGNLEVFIPELSVPVASVKVKFCPMCGRELS